LKIFALECPKKTVRFELSLALTLVSSLRLGCIDFYRFSSLFVTQHTI
jgi:hypothetical protein